MSITRFLSPLPLFVMISLAACGGDSEEYVVGSCQDAKLSDGARICIEASADSSSIVRQSCRIAKGRWVEAESCPMGDAVAGCRVKNGSTIWSYASDKVSTSADVRDDCNGLVIEVPPGS